jgi:predicted RNA-binding protein YlqC (UPF0109 family)
MNELISFILKSITGKDIPVSELEEEGRTVFEISPDEETIGLVIGKGGKTIKAIQELVRVRARKENKFIYLRIQEKEGN